MNTNPTPKQRCLTSKEFVSNHRNLASSNQFQDSLDFALLEYQNRLCLTGGTINDAAAHHMKITGALEFISVFMNLAETTVIPARKDVDNLTHK